MTAPALIAPAPSVSVAPSFAVPELSLLRLEFLGQESARIGGHLIKVRRRFCDILVLLSIHPNGLNGGQLSAGLYGEWAEGQNQTVEVHRLSKLVQVRNKPYRLVQVVSADFLEVQQLIAAGRVLEAVRLYRGELLPQSAAPAICEHREFLHEAVRNAASRCADLEPLWAFVSQFPEDLELLELLQARMPQEDVRCSLVAARLKITRKKMKV